MRAKLLHSNPASETEVERAKREESYLISSFNSGLRPGIGSKLKNRKLLMNYIVVLSTMIRPQN